MNIKKSRHKKQRARRGLSHEEQLQREWKRVQNFQKKNEKLKSDLQALVERVLPLIEKEERQMTELLFRQASIVLDFVQKKTCPQWCKDELLDFYYTNLELLSCCPFSDHLDLEGLIQRAYGIVGEIYGELLMEEAGEKCSTHASGENTEQSKKTRAQKRTETHRKAPIEDMFEDLFQEFENVEEGEHDADEKMDYDDILQQLFEEFEAEMEEDMAAEQASMEDRNKKLDKLLKESGINKMFRRIARVLHPDLEQDPKLKAERHEQMSELLKARDDKDIATLLNLYSRYIDSAPLDELGGDPKSVIKLLKNQVEMLKNEEEEIIHQNPLHADIYHRFHASSESGFKQRVQTHLKILRKQIRGQQEILADMTNIRAIKALMEDRRAARSFHEEFYH